MIDTYSKNALNKLQCEIDNITEDIHAVYKLYRQGRIWNRMQYAYEGRISRDVYHEINEELKRMRNVAKVRIKGE